MRRKMGLGCLGLLVVLVAGLGALTYLLFARVPGEYFDSNGVRIHYTVEGAGEPLILIHGLAANADLNWRRAGVNALLRKDFQVIAFDCRGHGLSDKPHQKEQYGPELVNDVTRLMDHLKIDKAHLAGYSMGGFIALEVAIRHPERVRSVALCASGWKDPNGDNDFSSAYRAPSKEVQDFVPVFKPAAANAVQAIADAPIAVDLPPVEPRERRRDRPDGERRERREKKEKPPKIWYIAMLDPVRDYIGKQMIDVQAVKALKDSFDLMDLDEGRLRANTVPAIGFMGTMDGLKPYGDAMAERMANLEYVILPGANHITTAMSSTFRSRLQQFFLANRSPADTVAATDHP